MKSRKIKDMAIMGSLDAWDLQCYHVVSALFQLTPISLFSFQLFLTISDYF